MSSRIEGKSIYLTRGDTFRKPVEALLPESETERYQPIEGDNVRFAMKRSYEDVKPVLVKDIPVDTMVLTLDPEDTKGLPFGKYFFDIQLTYANGDIDTFITKGRLHLTEEVD